MLDDEFCECLLNVIRGLEQKFPEWTKKRKVQRINADIITLANYVRRHYDAKNRESVKKVNKKIKNILNTDPMTALVFVAIVEGCSKVSKSLIERDLGKLGDTRKKGNEQSKHSIEGRLITQIFSKLQKNLQ